jgi:hypothetical protein
MSALSPPLLFACRKGIETASECVQTYSRHPRACPEDLLKFGQSSPFEREGRFLRRKPEAWTDPRDKAEDDDADFAETEMFPFRRNSL